MNLKTQRRAGARPHTETRKALALPVAPFNRATSPLARSLFQAIAPSTGADSIHRPTVGRINQWRVLQVVPPAQKPSLLARASSRSQLAMVAMDTDEDGVWGSSSYMDVTRQRERSKRVL
ncbi:hypothetical protein PHYPSEUDO_008321 [Phytophthora pseudosyringae]|uniref:Uncharacterized protein n=1 Tax=Phytophthora pseudosyringae TaxID=221518 RepID=A0A8T1VHK5_9STRA|nr:hypothetical protein PHYPSEUDO_008321 [Phytophthora pseudosyringae]